MILAAILFFGILTMWAPARWAVAAFQLALFALAIYEIGRRKGAISLNPAGLPLGAAAAWGVVQIVAHRSVYEARTREAVLIWIANLVAFSLAAAIPRHRRQAFLQAVLIFAFLLSMVATFTVLTSPEGKIFWRFDSGSGHVTLGPFVYRNQYAAFVEAALPLAIWQAIAARRRPMLYVMVAAMLFASVVAGGSRAGSLLCLAEILLTPVIAWKQRMIDGRKLGQVLAASVAATIGLTAVVGWESISSRLQEPNPYSLRAELLRSSMEMARDRPMLGFGLGTWSDAYPAYARFDDGHFVNQAHNDWAQWAAEAGVPFFLMMAALVVWRIRPAVRSLWGIGLIAVFVHCLVDYPMQQRPALPAFFFAMLGLLAD